MRWLVKLQFAERDAARQVELRGTEWSLGRANDNLLPSPGKTTSKHHARLLVRDGRLAIVDLKSSNGTYVNGQRISLPTVIDAKAKVYVGDVVFVVLAGPTRIDDDNLPAVRW